MNSLNNSLYIKYLRSNSCILSVLYFNNFLLFYYLLTAKELYTVEYVSYSEFSLEQIQITAKVSAAKYHLCLVCAHTK